MSDFGLSLPKILQSFSPIGADCYDSLVMRISGNDLF